MIGRWNNILFKNGNRFEWVKQNQISSWMEIREANCFHMAGGRVNLCSPYHHYDPDHHPHPAQIQNEERTWRTKLFFNLSTAAVVVLLGRRCVCVQHHHQTGGSLVFVWSCALSKNEFGQKALLNGPPPALDRYIVINKSKSPTTPAAQQGWPGRQKGNRIQRGKKQKQQQQLDPWSIWGGGEVISIHTHTHILYIS